MPRITPKEKAIMRRCRGIFTTADARRLTGYAVASAALTLLVARGLLRRTKPRGEFAWI